MGLTNNPSCRRCGAEEETSAHVLCECEALALLRHTHLGSLFLNPEDVKSLSLEAIWNFSNKIKQGSLDRVSDYVAQRASLKA